MSDDAKEWVTVKVEKPVRDDAQDDPRTYTEIMRAGLDAESAGNELEAAGLVALEDRLNEVAEMLESVQDNWEYLNGEEIHGGVHESEHQLRDVLDRLDRIESAASTAEERTGSIENTLENMGGR